MLCRLRKALQKCCHTENLNPRLKQISLWFTWLIMLMLSKTNAMQPI
jgi:hypothetical protein